jgi:hypothetical protein
MNQEKITFKSHKLQIDFLILNMENLNNRKKSKNSQIIYLKILASIVS